MQTTLKGKSKYFPYDAEAEKATIASMIVWPDTVVPSVRDRLGEKDFFVPDYQRVFRAVVEMFDAKMAIDIITLSSWLGKKSNESEGHMWPGLIAECVAGVASALNVHSYVRVVKDHALRRNVIEALRGLAAAAADGDISTDDLLESATNLKKLIENRSDDPAWMDVGMAWDLYLAEIEQRKNPDWHPGGVPFQGWETLQDWTHGMQPGELIVFAARPGVGKTAALLNICEDVCYARKQGDQWIAPGYRVGLISLEMTQAALLQRAAASVAGIDNKLLRGAIDEWTWAKLNNATSRIKEWQLVIDDSKSMTLSGLKKRMRIMRKTEKVDLIGIDYFQKIQKDDPRTHTYDHFSQISEALDQLADELQIPIVTLAQLNRAAARDKEPGMHQLAGCDRLEQDADKIILMHNKHVEGVSYHETGGYYDALWIVDKNRGGRTGRLKMKFHPKQVRFMEDPDQDFSSK